MYNNTPTNEVPKNIAEFIERGWDKKIFYRVSKHKLRDTLNDPEEMVQDIMLSLISTDYLARYSPEKRSFEVYIYIFVDNFIKKRLTKENTRNGRGIVSRASLENALPGNAADISSGVVYLETLKFAVTGDDTETVLFDEFLSEVREELIEKYKASSSVVYEGRELKRDPSTVLELVLEDNTVTEIAAMFNTSKQFIYNNLKKIRDTEAMKERKLRLGLK